MVAFSACSTFPVSTSTRICASAAARETERPNVTQRASAQVSIRAMVLSRKSITSAIRFSGPRESRGLKQQGGYVTEAGGKSKMELIGAADEQVPKNALN